MHVTFTVSPLEVFGLFIFVWLSGMVGNIAALIPVAFIVPSFEARNAYTVAGLIGVM